MTWRRAIEIAVLAPGLAACADDRDSCEERVPLVDHQRWTQVAETADPFRVDGLPRCGEANMFPEPFDTEPSFTVVTRGCSWGTVEQPALAAVRAGEPIRVRLWYASQTTSEVAEAELLVAVGDAPFFSRRVPLPASSGGLVLGSAPAPRDLAAGEPLRFHLSNHGQNTWNLLEVSVVRAKAGCGSGI